MGVIGAKRPAGSLLLSLDRLVCGGLTTIRFLGGDFLGLLLVVTAELMESLTF